MCQSSLISVIVPIYNVEKYLRDCVDSILSSSYSYLEVLLVDDGSPDNCGRICDEYAEKDGRVTVLHQKNQGLPGARNAGLAAASGEYIAFVDSDDMVSPVQFEVLASVMAQTGADLVGCGGCTELSRLSRTRSPAVSAYRARTYDEKLALLLTAPSVRKISWTGGYVWNKLYKKSLIKKAFSRECLICEDINFNWNYIQSCGDFVTIPEALYYYRQNERSVTSRYYRFETNPMQAVSNADALEEMARIPIFDPVLRGFFRARQAYAAHSALLRLCCTPKAGDYKTEILRMKRMFRACFQDLWRDRTTYNAVVRLSAALCRYAFFLWLPLIRLYRIVIQLRFRHS